MYDTHMHTHNTHTHTCMQTHKHTQHTPTTRTHTHTHTTHIYTTDTYRKKIYLVWYLYLCGWNNAKVTQSANAHLSSQDVVYHNETENHNNADHKYLTDYIII